MKEMKACVGISTSNFCYLVMSSLIKDEITQCNRGQYASKGAGGNQFSPVKIYLARQKNSDRSRQTISR